MSASASTTRRLFPRLGAAGLTAALAASLLTAVAAPAGAVNNVANGSFERSTSGWTVTKGAQLSRPRNAKAGHWAARVTNRGATRTVALNDRTNTVTSTEAGRTYAASLFVRTRQPVATVNLRLMEFAGSSLKGQANSAVTLRDPGWHKLRVAYTAKTNGASLDLNVVAWQLRHSQSFDVDGIALAPRAEESVQSAPAPVTPHVAPAPQDSAPSGWNLAWADEFNGTSLDRTKWNAENNSTYGDGNKELACLMDRKENLFVSGGAVTLRALRERSPFKCGNKDSRFPNGRDFTSAHLTTRNKASFQYGRFEMRAKLPTQAGTSKGLWPAFWMRPASGGTGELDIMEAVGSGASGNEANKVHQTIWYDYTGKHRRQATIHSLGSGSTFASGFHTFAVEWEPGEIRWYVDGKLTTTRNRSTTSWLDEAFGAKNKDFFIRLNLAVGGSWPGSPDASTDFPGDYVVDYVRVYKR